RKPGHDAQYTTPPMSHGPSSPSMNETERTKVSSPMSGTETSSRPLVDRTGASSLMVPASPVRSPAARHRTLGAGTATGRSVEVEREHPDRVAAQDLVLHLRRKVPHHLLGDLLGVRPRRVGVGVVRLEGDVVDADLVEAVEPVLVAEEAPVDLPVVVGRRRLRD